MQIKEQSLYKIKLTRLIFIAAVVCLIAAPILQQWLDSSLMFSWAQGFAKGFFNAYDGHVQYLDYPPLYFPVLWVIGIIDKSYPLADHHALLQFLLKIVPILFYMLSSLTVYHIACRFTTPLKAYYASLMMLGCVTIFVNAAYWAQIDAIEIFCVLWFLYFFDINRPYAGIMVFALCAVTKLQTLFFLPVILGYLILRQKPRHIFGSIFTGIGIGYACFLPFILPDFFRYMKANLINNAGFFTSLARAFGTSIHMDTGFLQPFHLYLNSFNGYPFASMNAFNFWSALGLNMKPLNTALLGISWLTPQLLGTAFLILSLLFPIAYAIACKIRKYPMNLWIAALLSLQTIYMFGSKIHDRYQIVVLPLLLILYVLYKDMRFGKAFIFITIITFINHLTTIVFYFNDATSSFFTDGLGVYYFIAFSLVNLAAYVYTVYISIPYLFRKEDIHSTIHLPEEVKCCE